MVDCADLTLVGGRCFCLRAAAARSTVVQPQAWLADALCSMVEHLTSRLYVLLPRNWKTRLSGHLSGPGNREFESVRSAGEAVIRRADVATDRGFITAHRWDRTFRRMRRSRAKHGLGEWRSRDHLT